MRRLALAFVAKQCDKYQNLTRDIHATITIFNRFFARLSSDDIVCSRPNVKIKDVASGKAALYTASSLTQM